MPAELGLHGSKVIAVTIDDNFKDGGVNELNELGA